MKKKRCPGEPGTEWQEGGREGNWQRGSLQYKSLGCCTMSIKMFAWLVIMDRVNTKDMIQRRHWKINDGPECVLCLTRVLEDINHLFFQCNFSMRIWNYLQITWLNSDDMVEIALHARKEFNKPFF